MVDVDYLTLRGNKYRVEVTYGALRRLCQAKGSDSLTALDNIQLSTFNDADLLIYNCLKEGAEFDNKKLDFAIHELGNYLRPKDIGKFLTIYQKQSQISSDQLEKKSLIKKIASRIRKIFKKRDSKIS